MSIHLKPSAEWGGSYQVYSLNSLWQIPTPTRWRTVLYDNSKADYRITNCMLFNLTQRDIVKYRIHSIYFSLPLSYTISIIYYRQYIALLLSIPDDIYDTRWYIAIIYIYIWLLHDRSDIKEVLLKRFPKRMNFTARCYKMGLKLSQGK